jgi:hypothetical protein
VRSFHSKCLAAAGLTALLITSVTAHAASSEVRAKKSFGVGASITGSTGVGTGLGLNVLYNVNKRLQVGVGLASSTWDATEYMDAAQDEKYKKETASTDNTYTTREATYNASVISAEARVFLGNSFNISGAVGSRSVQGDLVVGSDTDASGDRESTYRAQGIVTNIAVANDWTFDNGVTLGVDWAGISSGFSNSSDTKADDNDAATTSQTTARKDLQQFADKRLGSSVLHVLGLRAGWMF